MSSTPREDFEYRERIARRLMARDNSLPFGVALERVNFVCRRFRLSWRKNFGRRSRRVSRRRERC